MLSEVELIKLVEKTSGSESTIGKKFFGSKGDGTLKLKLGEYILWHNIGYFYLSGSPHRDANNMHPIFKITENGVQEYEWIISKLGDEIVPEKEINISGRDLVNIINQLSPGSKAKLDGHKLTFGDMRGSFDLSPFMKKEYNSPQKLLDRPYQKFYAWENPLFHGIAARNDACLRHEGGGGR